MSLRICIKEEDPFTGGVSATLIDGAVVSAVRSVLPEDSISPTVELKINFIKPAVEYLIAKAKLYHRGGKLSVGQAEIYDSNDNLVAIGPATFMILPKR